MAQEDQPIDQLYNSFDRGLYKITGEEEEDSILDSLSADASANNSANVSVSASDVASGISTATTNQATGTLQSGKTTFDNTVAGYIIGFDPTSGLTKFYIGNSTSYFNWDGNNLNVVGGVNVSSINIPDNVTANSFHVDSSGNAWWGATTLGASTAKILDTGAASFSSMTITGGSVATVALNKAVQGWSSDIVFSSASATQVNWSSGHIIMQDTTVYTISSGNTGTMATLTYIFLDLNVSTTVLQTTATYSSATGDGRVLIATAQNNATGASVIPLGGSQPIINGTSQITANSIIGGNIAASTITASNLTVSQLSAISANLGSITAGSININSGTSSIDSSGNAIFKSIQVGGSSVLYTISDQGIFSYGDGSDGTATCDGSTSVAGMSLAGSTYTLTRDVYFSSLTINNGVTVNPNGYRIFVKVTLTVNGAISGNGANGATGSNGATGTAGTGTVSGGAGATTTSALPDGYLKGSLAGPAGGTGGNGGSGASSTAGSNGTSGVNTTNSIGSNAVAAGSAGTGGIGDLTGGHNTGPGSVGTPGTVTASNVKLIANWHLATLLDISSSGSTVKFDNSASGAGGPGAGAGEGNQDGGSPTKGGAGGGGGAAGTNGRPVAIYAHNIVIGASGSITSNGGNGGGGGIGGAGATANGHASGGGGGGGGGSAGNGGPVILVYNMITNSGTISSNAGTGGTGGAGGAKGAGGSGTATNGTSGSNGSNGTAGTLYEFQISL